MDYAYLAIMMSFLFGISEVLSLDKSIKSNGIFELIYNTVVDRKEKPKT